MKLAAIVRRSFIAMFWGWVACNISIIPAATVVCRLEDRPLPVMSEVFVMFSLYSVPVVLLAWLFVFLPVDLAVPQRSRLRHRCIAPLLGGISGFTAMGFYAMMDRLLHPGTFWKETMRALSEPDSWPYLVGASVCGLTASLHLVLHHPRQEQAGVPASLSDNPPNDL
ncbi:hypothetical protein WJU23_20755 [Prosthecobacter sp. SYSU 5D2]|uniref:hypothetical protein n=1 Tax=Prosthecobacter sp. SYSU 5D2 TaxID=3134134 RepID=UPI0031FE78E1